MRIAIASGKGGTGKTTVAVAFAISLPEAQFVDADAEEPNAHLFLHPTIVEMYEVNGWRDWSTERNTEAIGAYRRGIEANPESWEAAFALGFHYFNVGDYEKALPYLARAQELGAAPIMLHTYAHALEKAGRVEDSLREWEYLRKLEPDSHIPPQQIERLLKRQGMGNGGGGRREAGSWKRRTAGDSSRS